MKRSLSHVSRSRPWRPSSGTSVGGSTPNGGGSTASRAQGMARTSVTPRRPTTTTTTTVWPLFSTYYSFFDNCRHFHCARALGTSTTTSTSLPLSPFETTTATTTPDVSGDDATTIANNNSNHNPTTTTTTNSQRPREISKSPAQIWMQMSQDLLQEPPAQKFVTMEEKKNMLECIKWWIRKTPPTFQTQDHVWKLWHRYQQAVVLRDTASSGSTTTHPPQTSSTKSVMDEELFVAIVDHWRLAVLQGISTPYTLAQVLTQVRQHPTTNINTTIKLYGMILDAMSHLGRPQEADDLVELLQQEGVLQQADEASKQIIWNSVLTAWARSSSFRPHAAQRAVAIMRQQMEHVNSRSYAIVLEAIAKHLENSSESSTPTPPRPTGDDNTETNLQLMEDIFAQAQRQNKLSEMAWLQRLRGWGAVNKDKARELLYILRQQYLSSSDANTATTNTTATGDDDDTVTTIAPNQYLFTMVMSAFAKVGDLDTVQELWRELSALHEQFEVMHGQGGSGRDTTFYTDTTESPQSTSPFLPSSPTLTAVLNSFGKSKDPQRAEKAQALLEAMMEHPSTRRIVDRAVLNCVLDAWAGSSNPKNIEAAQDMIAFMMQSGNKALRPDSYTYNALLKALSRSNRAEVLHVSKMVLKEMWKGYRAGNQDVKPNAVSYNTVLYAYSRLAWSGSAVYEAEALFEELWKEYNSNKDPSLLPTEATYVSMITTWIRSKRKEAPSRAAFYFDHLRAKHHHTRDAHFQPTVRIYNALIDSHRLYGDVAGAERTLRRMMTDYENGNVKAQPTTVIFNTVMNVYLKSQDRRAPHKIEKLLREMTKLAGTKGWPCRPDTRTYSIVMEGWSSLRSENSAIRAEAVFRDLQKLYAATGDKNLRPDRHSFTSYMNAWAKSGSPDAPEKVTEIFQQMVQNYERGEKDLGPGSVDYVLLLSAWSRSTRPEAPSKALAILDEMVDQYNMDQERYPKPRAEHFGAVINAFAEHGYIELAEAVLDRVLLGREGVHPNRSCWNGVLKACLRSNVEDAPERAAIVIERMKKHAQLGFRESHPDVVVYTTLLEIWRASRRDNAFQEGIRVLDEILAETDYKKKVKLEAGIFHSLLKNLKESSLSIPNKAEHLDGLLHMMKQYSIQPTPAIRKVVTDLRNEGAVLYMPRVN